MSETQLAFELNPQIRTPNNMFAVVHIYNQSDTYHLIRQLLVDSAMTESPYNFFYQILALPVSEFNTSYGSFAYIAPRYADTEADVYLNVDAEALNYIIRYMQTAQLVKFPTSVLDLATMFAMSNLINIIRSDRENTVADLLHSDTKISVAELIRYCLNLKS